MPINSKSISITEILQAVVIAGIVGCFTILYGIHNWQIRAEEREANRSIKLNEMSADMKEIKIEVKVFKETDMQQVKDRLKELELKNP